MKYKTYAILSGLVSGITASLLFLPTGGNHVPYIFDLSIGDAALVIPGIVFGLCTLWLSFFAENKRLLRSIGWIIISGISFFVAVTIVFQVESFRGGDWLGALIPGFWGGASLSLASHWLFGKSTWKNKALISLSGTLLGLTILIPPLGGKFMILFPLWQIVITLLLVHTLEKKTV